MGLPRSLSDYSKIALVGVIADATAPGEAPVYSFVKDCRHDRAGIIPFVTPNHVLIVFDTDRPSTRKSDTDGYALSSRRDDYCFESRKRAKLNRDWRPVSQCFPFRHCLIPRRDCILEIKRLYRIYRDAISCYPPDRTPL